jgi:hypothetical protein
MPFRKTPWPWPSRDANFDASPKLVIIREPAVQTHRPGSSLQRICRTTFISISCIEKCHRCFIIMVGLVQAVESLKCQPLLCLPGQVAPKKSSLQPAIIWSNLGGVDGAIPDGYFLFIGCYPMVEKCRKYGQTPHSGLPESSGTCGSVILNPNTLKTLNP